MTAEERPPKEVPIYAPTGGMGYACGEARQWSQRLRVPLAIADKRGVDHSESAEIVELIGSVEGRTALIVEDCRDPESRTSVSK